MQIRMYNCYFGDCFRLKHESEDLLVDFGIDTKRIKGGSPTQRFEEIYSDIQNEQMDFLLSHYHEDHFNGVLYTNQKYDYRFRDIYIPDIWSYEGAIDAINIVLLKEILEMYFLNKKTTIYEFLRAICMKSGRIHFVSRGSTIQGKYIALWPSSDYIMDKATEVLNKAANAVDLNEEEKSWLNQISRETRRRIRILLSGELNDNQRGELIEGLFGLEGDLVSFVDSLRNRSTKLGSKAKRLIVKLSEFENDISIVFQNKENVLSENVLFTGDFGYDPELWNIIEINKDKNSDCYMHPVYRVIKIPHHGTRSYYHSFVPYINSNSILMIPNGDFCGKWNISSDYSLNAITITAKVCCSTSKSCEAKNCNKGFCTCFNSAIIENTGYFFADIS